MRKSGCNKLKLRVRVRPRNGDISLSQRFLKMGASTADCIWQRAESIPECWPEGGTALGNSTTTKGNCMNTKKFSGKVVLVTGGTSGIGKTTAIEFARAGAKVVLTGRREKEGAQVVAEIKKLGGEAAFIRADVAKDADVKRMVDFTVATYGRLDIAFNNAGVEWIGPLDQATEAEYRRIFDINVWGVLNSMRHEIPAMLKSGGGAIVNTSSVAGHIGMAPSIYTASKHAVEGL